MKFFRSIRKNLVVKLAYINYFKYAIGEIFLVVIGILFALQINNWNESRKQEKIIQNYYIKMTSEIDSMLELIEYNTTYTESITKDLKFCIDYMGNNRKDSLSLYVEKLKLMTDCDAQTFYFPVINEFLSQGYLTKIYDKEISKYFEMLAYYEKQINANDNNRNEFCVFQMQPFVQKNINYAELLRTGDENSYFNLPSVITKNGPKTDFEKLQNSIELWNIIYRKLEIERETIVNNKSLINTLKRIKRQIKKLENKE
jgi:hypothetical protein